MKRIKLLIFSILLFFLCIIKIYAEDTITWVCKYDYVYTYSNNKTVNVSFKYQVKNIPIEILKNTNSLSTVGKKYTTVYHTNKKGEWSSKTWSNDFVGYATVLSGGPGYLHLDNPLLKTFVRYSVNNSTIVCPDIYVAETDTSCGVGGIYPEFGSKHMCVNSSSARTYEYDNHPTTKSGPTCYDSAENVVSCNSIVSKEALTDAGVLSCEYQSDAWATKNSHFKITYDPVNGMQFDPAGGGLTLDQWMNKESLENVFKIQYEIKKSTGEDRCPLNVNCNVFAGAITIGGADYTGSNYCGQLNNNNGQTIRDPGEYLANITIKDGDFQISDKQLTCRQMLGESLYAVLHMFITGLQIVGAILAIVSGMLAMIPAITSNDAGALKKATTKCIYLAIILVAIGLFRPIIRLIGIIGGFDLSCL